MSRDFPPPDPAVVQAMIPWKVSVDELGNRQVGSTIVDLLKSSCNVAECNIGSLIADSMVSAFIPLAEPGHWTYGAIAVIAVGGIRVSMFRGGNLEHFCRKSMRILNIISNSQRSTTPT